MRFREKEVKNKRNLGVDDIRDMNELKEFIIGSQTNISKVDVMKKIEGESLNNCEINEEMRGVLAKIDNKDLSEVVEFWMKKWIKREKE